MTIYEVINGKRLYLYHKTKEYGYYNNDLISIKLGAKENDIICMRNKNTDIYRLVVN